MRSSFGGPLRCTVLDERMDADAFVAAANLALLALKRTRPVAG
jgi:hypothetical protein